MKTREQIEVFKGMLLGTITMVKNNPKNFGIKKEFVLAFISAKELQIAVLDWVLSDNAEAEI